MTELAVQLVTISPEEEGQRLDNFLLKWAKGVPKSHIYRIIRSGEVRINKKRALVTSRILSGDIIRIPPIRIATPEIVPNAHKNTLNAIFISDNPDLNAFRPIVNLTAGSSNILGIFSIISSLKCIKYLS